MTHKLHSAFQHEMTSATDFYHSKDYQRCFTHLERAHILGQRYYIPHITAHWWMLKVGLKVSDTREIFGQLIRILASVGSIIGWVPTGNTGGTNISALKSLPIPTDLKPYLTENRQNSASTVVLRVLTTVTVVASAAWLL